MIVHVYTQFQSMTVQNNNILKFGKTKKSLDMISVDEQCRNIITLTQYLFALYQETIFTICLVVQIINIQLNLLYLLNRHMELQYKNNVLHQLETCIILVDLLREM